MNIEDVLLLIWAMKRNRARLNIHGGKQTLGFNYWETYEPVVIGFAIRLMIVCAMVLV